MRRIGTRSLSGILMLGTLIVFTGCSDEGDPIVVPVQEEPISFSSDIQPIFDSSCVGCHGSGGNGGMDLRPGESYGNLVGIDAVGSSGFRVEAGNSAASFLVQRLAGSAGGVMPPDGPLPASTVEKVTTWIDAGALDN
jgi:Planctomycete cytochrome C